jgi:hypothetical protein
MTDEPVKMEAETPMPTPTIEETAEQKLARGEAPIKKE